MDKTEHENKEREFHFRKLMEEYFILHKDIFMLHADGDNTTLFTKSMGMKTITRRISVVLAKLDDDRFCTSHRSNAVNLEYVSYVERNKAGTKKKCIVLKDGFKSELAYNRRKAFKAAIEAWKKNRHAE